MRAARALLLAIRILGADELWREAGLELGELALVIGLLVDEPPLQPLRTQSGTRGPQTHRDLVGTKLAKVLTCRDHPLLRRLA